MLETFLKHTPPESLIKDTITHVKDDIKDTLRWTESIIRNMTDNQVTHVRNFLETYTPNSAPTQAVVKALDYISPSESPTKSRSRSNSSGEESAHGVDPVQLAAALEK